MIFTGKETHIHFESAAWVPAAISTSMDLDGLKERSFEIVSNMYAPVCAVRGLWDSGDGMLVQSHSNSSSALKGRGRSRASLR